MKKRIMIIGCMMTLTLSHLGAQNHHLWYARPASHWLEALPVGNSHLGAMVYGGTDTEEIQLNEETFWSGSPHSNNSTESLQALPEVRRLIFEGKEQEASKLIDKYFVKGPHGMRFLPMGSLKLTLGHTEAKDYRRELNLGDALATTTYKNNGVKYERTVFASQADNVLIVRLTASKKGALSLGVGFDSPLQKKVFTVSSHEGINGNVNELAAVVDGVDQEGIKAGLKAEFRALVEADGKVERGVDKLTVSGATTVTIYVTAATNFVNYQDVSGNPVKKNNETLAVMGPTGSGKTTIASLIGRFFDVKEGSVKIDGVDVRKYDLAYLRSNIGMATQDVFLFSETVDSNIAYGDEDLPEEDVKKFAVAADADSFIRKMPDGYSTIVGERGIGLSGGQRQRIALARALAVRPSILILDDTTSAVDVETEQYIWNQLAKDEFKCTRIVIANRVSSVRDADQILILNADGSIRETGSHDELMEKKGYYYETFMLQNEGIMSGVTEAASEGGAD